MPTIVHPDGSTDARIAIVGARPGENEAREGIGFTGPSGKLLWDLLGIPRSSCYVTNVRKDFSRINSTPTRHEIHEVLPDLKAELEGTKANVIIAIGGDALYALTGRKSIDTWRGSILESTLLPGRKVIGTFHTAATLHTKGVKFAGYNLRYLIKLDLKRALNESLFPDIRRRPREFILDPDLDRAVDIVRSLGDPITVDIETFGDTISCFALSDSPSRAVCLPIIGSQLYPSELARIWREVDVKLRTSRVWAQNAQFDVTKLERVGFRIPRIDFDTLLWHAYRWAELGSASSKRKAGIANVDDPTGKHNLGFIVSIYCNGEPFYKHESEEAWTKPGLSLGDRFHKYWTYNCKDAACTHEAAEGMQQECDAWGTRKYFDTHVMGLIRPVMAMQSRGFRVDQDARNKVAYRLSLETEYLQIKLNNSVGFDCNVKSSVDLRYLLHDVLKMPKLKETKGGAPSTDEDTLLQLAYGSEYEDLFRLILAIRERRTMTSGFLNMELDERGYYVASYMIHGAGNGRLSSRAIRKGPQLQNIPMFARRLFTASPGCVLINADLTRAEAMYVAYDTQDPRLIEIFEDRTRDFYCEVATTVLGRKITKADKLIRDLFKAMVHAFNYGMGPRKFVMLLRARGIDIMKIDVPGSGPEAKGKFILNGYGSRFSSIIDRQNRIRKQLRGEYVLPGERASEKRLLVTPWGRKRQFLGPLWGSSAEDTMRIAFAYEPSAMIVAVTNQAVRRLHEQGEPINAQTHDSITLDCPLEREAECTANTVKALTEPITLHGKTFTIPVEIKRGFNWCDANEKDNPNGLKAVA